MSISPMSITVREVAQNEMPFLLALYAHLQREDVPLTQEQAENIWRIIRDTPGISYWGAYRDEVLTAACTLTVIPNLTRGGRPYGLIENVVTHPDYRRQGRGTAILQRALQEAWANNCYKVMLLTGTKDEAKLRFYEQAGFERGVKTGFVARPGG